MIAMLPITLVLFLFHISSSQSACSSSKFIQKLKSSTTNTSDYDQRIQQQIAISDVIGNKTDMKTSQEMLSANQSIIQSTSSLASVNDFNAPFQATSSSDPAGAKTLGQELSLNDLHSFRLEYNKYKILSHLGIGSNPDSIKPAMDDDLRSKLTTSTAMSDSANSLSSSRRKRSLSCDQVKGNKNACCLENFYVNFTHIGWDKWILYPAGYNANYCRGQCDLSHARYYHSTLLSKYSNVISLCCSPKQMAPLKLLYIDEGNKVHEKSIPDMVVESCDCA